MSSVRCGLVVICKEEQKKIYVKGNRFDEIKT